MAAEEKVSHLGTCTRTRGDCRICLDEQEAELLRLEQARLEHVRKLIVEGEAWAIQIAEYHNIVSPWIGGEIQLVLQRAGILRDMINILRKDYGVKHA